MNLVPYSWNGYQINDWWWNNQVGEYSSEFPVGQRMNLQSTGIYSPLAYAFPKLSTAQVDGHQISLLFHPKSLTHSLSFLREQLKQWFAIGVDFTPHQLIAQDVENGNKQWYLTGLPVADIENSIGEYAITLSLSDPIWRVVTPSTSGNISVVASPNTQNLTIIGNVPAQPIITITPTSGRTGSFLYKRYVPIYNTTANPFPFVVSAVDITNGGLDTATLIAGGKMQSAGQDVRVIVDGAYANFWFGGGGINSATTLIWIDLPHSIGQVGTLLTSLPNNGTTVTVTFNKTAANLTALQQLATAVNQAFIIGSEVFTYSRANVDLVNYQITSCLRAQKSTSFAAHASNANITWIEHDVWLMYGNTTATAFVTDDTKKPIIDLTNSRNNSWVWANFRDLTNLSRPGTWQGFRVASITDSLLQPGQGPLTRNYGGNQGDITTNPATEIGNVMRTINYNNVEKAETAVLGWKFYHPAGFITTSFAGNKYTQYAASWPSIAGLQKSTDNINWTQVWNEAIPGNIAAWTNTFTHNTVSLSGTYQYLMILFQGSIPAKSGNQAFIQCDTVTLALGAGVLTVSLNAEINNYHLNPTILNNTSGESIILDITLVNNQSVTIDCGAKTATLADGTNVFNGVTLSPNRTTPNWLDLGKDTNNKFTGAAQLIYTESGLTGETLNYTWKDSSL